MNLVYLLAPLDLSRYAKMLRYGIESCVFACTIQFVEVCKNAPYDIESCVYGSLNLMSITQNKVDMTLNLECGCIIESVEVCKFFVCFCIPRQINDKLSRYVKMLDMTDIESCVFSCTIGICQGWMYNLATVFFARVYIYGFGFISALTPKNCGRWTGHPFWAMQLST